MRNSFKFRCFYWFITLIAKIRYGSLAISRRYSSLKIRLVVCVESSFTASLVLREINQFVARMKAHILIRNIW